MIFSTSRWRCGPIILRCSAFETRFTLPMLSSNVKRCHGEGVPRATVRSGPSFTDAQRCFAPGCTGAAAGDPTRMEHLSLTRLGPEGTTAPSTGPAPVISI